MDKKELKRDIATFAYDLKNLMNKPLDNPLITLDRDLQYFMYGRISTLIKHSDGKPIGSLADIGAVTGAALGVVVSAFCKDRIEGEQLNELISSVREQLTQAFDSRTLTNHSTENESSTEEVIQE